MSEFEINNLLNLLADAEVKEQNWATKSLDNMRKLWNRDYDMLQERLSAITKDATAHSKLRKKLENLRQEVENVTSKEKSHNSQISELEKLLSKTENEIRCIKSEEEKLKQHYETRAMELSKLEKIEAVIKNRQLLYDCLNTQLSYVAPNNLKISFVDNSKSIGWIQFVYDENRDYFTVAEICPEGLVPDSIVNKFHETQDTQGLLCYVYQNLFEKK